MKCETMFVIVSILASFSAIFSEAVTANSTENNRRNLFCTETCSKLGQIGKVDLDTNDCICYNPNVSKVEQSKLNSEGVVELTKMSSKRDVSLPPSTTKTVDVNKPITPIEKKHKEETLKLRKKKKFDDDKVEHKEHIEVIPKKDDEVLIPKEAYENSPMGRLEMIPQEPELALKRNPKQALDSDEIETHRSRPLLLKGLRKPKISAGGGDGAGISEDDSTLGKPIITQRKQTNPCASTTIKNQLQTAKDRISNLMEEMDRAVFNCVTLNSEIESIKSLLQEATYKTPETRQREAERARIREHIRERQAKIQARFGRIEIARPKHLLLGKHKDKILDSGEEVGVIDR